MHFIHFLYFLGDRTIFLFKLCTMIRYHLKIAAKIIYFFEMDFYSTNSIHAINKNKPLYFSDLCFCWQIVIEWQTLQNHSTWTLHYGFGRNDEISVLHLVLLILLGARYSTSLPNKAQNLGSHSLKDCG